MKTVNSTSNIVYKRIMCKRCNACSKSWSDNELQVSVFDVRRESNCLSKLPLKIYIRGKGQGQRRGNIKYIYEMITAKQIMQIDIHYTNENIGSNGKKTPTHTWVRANNDTKTINISIRSRCFYRQKKVSNVTITAISIQIMTIHSFNILPSSMRILIWWYIHGWKITERCAIHIHGHVFYRILLRSRYCKS